MQHGNKTRGTGPLGGAGVVGLWGASSFIKSIQRGTCSTGGSTSGTATITAVDTANCTVRFLGYVDGNASDGATVPDVHFARIALTNSTTVTITRAVLDVAASRVARFEVIEFLPGLLRSVQRGTVTITSGGPTSATTTITGVDPNKTILGYLGFTTTYPASSNNVECVDVALTNGTTVTSTVANAAATSIVSFETLEFY